MKYACGNEVKLGDVVIYPPHDPNDPKYIAIVTFIENSTTIHLKSKFWRSNSGYFGPAFILISRET